MLITIRTTYIYKYYSTTTILHTRWEKWKSNLIMKREEKDDRNLVMTFFWN